MAEELRALELNKTWSIVSLPEGKDPVGCKWVFKTKYKADGSIERHKARLVAKGYTQLEGIDFVDTFSPVAKLVTVKILLALAAIKGWTLSQLDVTNAFLHGDLTEEVYMELPLGYLGSKGESMPLRPICRLHKSIYGLRQASRQWFNKFSAALISEGFVQSQCDHSLFIKKSSADSFTALLVYVDNIVIASNDDDAVAALKLALNKRFRMKDLGPLRYFLGLEVARSAKGISISQRKYALELLAETRQLGCKTSSVLMDPAFKLSESDGELLDDPKSYRRLIGKLIYLTITRPYLSFSVSRLSQFMANPKTTHMRAATRIL